MRVDEKTSIPITWFAALMGAVISCGGVSSFWIFTVNARLSRIEDKLGITGSISYFEEHKKFVEPPANGQWVTMVEKKTIKKEED